MKVTEERGGWFIEAEDQGEHSRLEWLITSLRSSADWQLGIVGENGPHQPYVAVATPGLFANKDSENRDQCLS